jgi:hypothetical protein
MPTAQTQPDTDHAPVWARFGHYIPYTAGSQDDAKDTTLTNFFHILSVIDTYLGEDAAQTLTHEHTWRGSVPAVGGEAPLFTYYFVDRRAMYRAVKQYLDTKIEPSLKRMNESKETQQRYATSIKTYQGHKAQLEPVLNLLADRYSLVTISSHLVVVADHSDEHLRHVWECPDLGTVRILVQSLSNAGLPFNGPLVVKKEPATKSTDANANTALRVLFNEVNSRHIQIPRMPDASGIQRNANLFPYELSGQTDPSISEYFSSLVSADGASQEFQKAAKSLGDYFASSPATLFFVAKTHEDGHAHWSYFVDEAEAKQFLAIQVLVADETFASRLKTAFGESEAFKNHSQVDSVVDFIVPFLAKPAGHHFSVLTAFSHKEAPADAAKSPASKIPPVLGILLKPDGDTIDFSIFNAKSVFVSLANDKQHMDKHGMDLTDNLINHSMWANLIDFAASIYGERELLKIGGAKTIKLKEDPEGRVLEFASLFNTYFG